MRRFPSRLVSLIVLGLWLALGTLASAQNSTPEPPKCAVSQCDFRGWADVVDYLHSGANALGVVVAAVLGLVSYFLKIFGERLAEQAKKSKRKIELLEALKAEILDTLEKTRNVYDPSVLTNWRTQNAADPGFFPYAPTVKSDFVFDIIKREITSMDARFQEDLTKYYYYDQLTTKMFDDVRSDEIRSLPQPRKEQLFEMMFGIMTAYGSSAEALLPDITAAIRREKEGDLFRPVTIGLIATIALLFLAKLIWGG